MDDLADACVFLMNTYSEQIHINVGCGQEISILELAHMVARAVGYKGQILTDPSKPDGTPRKLMDSSRLFALGWTPQIKLEDGLKSTYAWYCKQLRDGGVRE